MKTTIITVLMSLAISFSLMAQDFKGYATYKTQRKLDIKLDSSQISSEMHERMLAMMKKQFEKEYTLSFTKEETLFEENEKLESPRTMGGAEVRIVMAGDGAADVLYKNVKDNRFANQNELFGKEFLIKDEIPELEWKLEKETKNIGQYTCFKASYSRTDTIRSSFNHDVNGEKSDSEHEEIQERTITAWYTPQIPVPHGPRMFGGLPGLILEVNDGSESILCSKIVLNPSEGVTIKEPGKGKVVSQAEYDVILQKKMDEQAEQFESDGRRHGDGNNVRIRIGG